MSEENVELARRYFAAYNEKGLYGTDELRHPEIEVFDPPTFTDQALTENIQAAFDHRQVRRGRARCNRGDALRTFDVINARE